MDADRASDPLLDGLDLTLTGELATYRIALKAEQGRDLLPHVGRLADKEVQAVKTDEIGWMLFRMNQAFSSSPDSTIVGSE